MRLELSIALAFLGFSAVSALDGPAMLAKRKDILKEKTDDFGKNKPGKTGLLNSLKNFRKGKKKTYKEEPVAVGQGEGKQDLATQLQKKRIEQNKPGKIPATSESQDRLLAKQSKADKKAAKKAKKAQKKADKAAKKNGQPQQQQPEAQVAENQEQQDGTAAEEERLLAKQSKADKKAAKKAKKAQKKADKAAKKNGQQPQQQPESPVAENQEQQDGTAAEEERLLAKQSKADKKAAKKAKKAQKKADKAAKKNGQQPQQQPETPVAENQEQPTNDAPEQSDFTSDIQEMAAIINRNKNIDSGLPARVAKLLPFAQSIVDMHNQIVNKNKKN